MFVSAGDELGEQVRCFRFEGDVADFVDDQQRRSTVLRPDDLDRWNLQGSFRGRAA